MLDSRPLCFFICECYSWFLCTCTTNPCDMDFWFKIKENIEKLNKILVCICKILAINFVSMICFLSMWNSTDRNIISICWSDFKKQWVVIDKISPHNHSSQWIVRENLNSEKFLKVLQYCWFRNLQWGHSPLRCQHYSLDSRTGASSRRKTLKLPIFW